MTKRPSVSLALLDNEAGFDQFVDSAARGDDGDASYRFDYDIGERWAASLPAGID